MRRLAFDGIFRNMIRLSYDEICEKKYMRRLKFNGRFPNMRRLTCDGIFLNMRRLTCDGIFLDMRRLALDGRSIKNEMAGK